MSSSLKKLCKTFDTSVQKKDYDILAIYKTNFHENCEDVYSYLKHDILSLAEIVLGLNKIYNNFGIHLNDVLTSSAFSLRCVQKEGFTSFVIRNQTMRDFIRSCLYGGRTQHVVSRFDDGLNGLQRVIGKWKERVVDDCLHGVRVKDFLKLVPAKENFLTSTGVLFSKERFVVALDANSLYPTAMKQFPVHNGRVHVNENVKSVSDFDSQSLYFCQIDEIVPPEGLVFPILPVRKEDHIEWSGRTIVDGTYTSIDLLEAHKRGYSIGNVVKCLEISESSTALQNCVESLYRQRLQTENPILRDILKLILNSIYGRMCQKDIHSSYSLYDLDSTGKLLTVGRKPLYRCNVVSTEESILNRGVLVESVRKTIMPTNIAAEILSISKLVMNKLIDCCGGIVDQPCGFYTDTDCLYVLSTKLDIIENKGFLGKKLGQFKNDLGDREFIILGYFPQSKVKLCVTVNDVGEIKIHRTMKGMSNTVCTEFVERMYTPTSYEFKEYKFYSWLKLLRCFDTEINSFEGFMKGETIHDLKRKTIKRLIGLGLINTTPSVRQINLIHAH